jgi:hypothetical protein
MGSNNENKIKRPFRWSRFWGYALFIFGFLNVADLMSPLRVPAAGVIGGISILAGFILLLPDKMAFIRKIALQWKNAPNKKQLTDTLLPVKILRLAREHGGILTLSTVAIELNVPLDEAEAGLDECIRSGQAMPDFDMTKEVKYYRFQEHIPRQPDSE